MLRVPRVLGTDELAHPGSRDILLERHLVGLHLAEHLNVSRGDEIASLGGRGAASLTVPTLRDRAAAGGFGCAPSSSSVLPAAPVCSSRSTSVSSSTGTSIGAPFCRASSSLARSLTLDGETYVCLASLSLAKNSA